MKKIGKKGSQVGMVLSFIIFVTSMFFIYLIVSPYIARESSKSNSFDLLKENVLANLTSDVWVFRVNGSLSGCIQMEIPVIISGAESVAFGEGSSISSSVSGGYIFVEEGASRIKVYYSDLIVNPNPFLDAGCIETVPDSTSLEKAITEKSIISLMDEFSANYNSLKEELNVFSSDDFDLYFIYSNGTTIGEIRRDPSTEVYAEELKIYYLSSGAQNEVGILRVKLW